VHEPRIRSPEWPDVDARRRASGPDDLKWQYRPGRPSDVRRRTLPPQRRSTDACKYIYPRNRTLQTDKLIYRHPRLMPAPEPGQREKAAPMTLPHGADDRSSRSAAARQRLRAHLAGDFCLRPASVFDPISARLAEDAGFELGMYAGSVASLVVLGAPDIILLTLSEFADQARRICRASPIALLCDADHGYGNALNAMRAVEELDAAGVAGLTIEDTDLPQRLAGKAPPPTSLREGLGKMRAAVAARNGGDICVFARTGALATTGLDDALERLKAYQETGVDGMFFSGATARREIEAIAKVARVPVLLGALGPDIDDAEFLAAHGVRIALPGHQPFMAAVEAIRACMRAQRTGAALPPLASKQTMATATRQDIWDERMKAFL